MRRTAFLSYVLAVGCVLAACADAPPTAPPIIASPLAATATSDGQVTIDPVVAVLTALDDVRTRVVPTLGTAQEIADLAAALQGLAGVLETGRGSLASRIKKATDAVVVLEDVVEDDAGRRADLKVVLLAIEAAEDLA
jgi:hypothetical protein